MAPRSTGRTFGRQGGTEDRPAIFFSGPEEFRAWLEANHETASELWMGLNRRHVADRGLRWEEAVPEALAFGWIDSKAERIDEDRRRQRWTPRRRGSNWSKINIETVERLIAEGRMTPAGLAAYEARRADRSGAYSYESSTELSPEHAALLAADAAAAAFWAQATPSYRRICVSWVCSAKQDATRERRIVQLVDDCASGRLIKIQAYGDPPKWLERAAAAARSARP
ncbi:YdeI/OmpD-associated family protein [Desertimonas flava]|uniref:YdeI/OmpD-associated family protein n=1 Tax=Desertimonas flava TaxID=2064846 RepID=UPI000E341A46|nr:YdeI/OmpD-associated family protein [Desertimonas flava]